MRVLVVNAGSSTVKLRLLDTDDTLIAERELPAAGGDAGAGRLEDAVAAFPAPDAIGHRIVHGGERSAAVALDDGVLAELRALGDLAPLHQPATLRAHDAVAGVLPGIVSVGCFDTAFHTTLAPAAATYALPRAWRERWPVRRFGFHGLSHAYVARRAAELVGRPAGALRIVSCHLGAGASACAIAGGRSVDTTMGFTPLEGLVMATRAGDVDPGVLLWLLRDGRLSLDALADGLQHESGLTGLAGTADMRDVLARERDGDGAAGLALEVYVHRLRAAIAGMAAALGGMDVLAFTGGVGEHAPALRARVVEGLGFLGAELDASANAAARADAIITAPSARAQTVVVSAREDLEIARQVRTLVGSSQVAGLGR